MTIRISLINQMLFCEYRVFLELGLNIKPQETFEMKLGEKEHKKKELKTRQSNRTLSATCLRLESEKLQVVGYSDAYEIINDKITFYEYKRKFYNHHFLQLICQIYCAKEMGMNVNDYGYIQDNNNKKHKIDYTPHTIKLLEDTVELIHKIEQLELIINQPKEKMKKCSGCSMETTCWDETTQNENIWDHLGLEL